jgi:hypothetical protein
LTVTTIDPDDAPTGIGKLMLLLLQAVGFAGIPLKTTVLLPVCWVSPKLVPVRVTRPPTGALDGEMPVTTEITKNGVALLATPLTVTMTSALPGSNALGTGAVILVSLQ